MMTFYMTPGSCSTGIHILLEELELIFSAHVLNLPAGDNHKPEFLAINPKGTIPVLLLDDGTALTDFLAIAWWLATSYPKAKLLPDSVKEQAESLNVINDIVNNIHMQGFTRLFTTERYIQRETDRSGVEAQGRILVKKGFNDIAHRLQNAQGYLFGRFTIADAALFYVEFWAQRIDLELPEACVKHLQLMQSRPVVQRVLAEEGYRIR
jgi:glutathione S-transferase